MHCCSPCLRLEIELAFGEDYTLPVPLIPAIFLPFWGFIQNILATLIGFLLSCMMSNHGSFRQISALGIGQSYKHFLKDSWYVRTDCRADIFRMSYPCFWGLDRTQRRQRHYLKPRMVCCHILSLVVFLSPGAKRPVLCDWRCVFFFWLALTLILYQPPSTHAGHAGIVHCKFNHRRFEYNNR